MCNIKIYKSLNIFKSNSEGQHLFSSGSEFLRWTIPLKYESWKRNVLEYTISKFCPNIERLGRLLQTDKSLLIFDVIIPDLLL